jgi:NADPH2:quinone reductase
MKAVVLKEFGGPENLSLGDLPIPSVEPGAVLIRAKAASANPADVSISKGTPFSPALPAVLGCDVAGVVEAVGDGVAGFAPGDEVFGCVGGVRGSGGTLAEYVLADARLLARKPQTLSMREAAALPLVAITAHEGIDAPGFHRPTICWSTAGPEASVMSPYAPVIAAPRRPAAAAPGRRAPRWCRSRPRG